MPLESFRSSMALPTPTADGANALGRGSRYGEPWYLSALVGTDGAAAEGSYWRACNPTPGTALAQAVTAGFADTTPLICIRNTDATGGKTIYLDYVALLMTVIPASATAWDLAVTIDPNARAPTAGTALAGQCVNTLYAPTSICTATFGPTSVAAAVARRLVSRRRIFNAIPVVNSVLFISFGAQDWMAGQTISGTTAVNLACPCGPLAIAPGHTGLIHLWYPSNATTGASYEAEMGWIER
jgi:hypothetical protein